MVEPGNEEFPVPFAQFAQTLRRTPDEVWIHYMRIVHGRENHTLTEWRALHDNHRDKPAHWSK
jgi:hypothetical protein